MDTSPYRTSVSGGRPCYRFGGEGFISICLLYIYSQGDRGSLRHLSRFDDLFHPPRVCTARVLSLVYVCTSSFSLGALGAAAYPDIPFPFTVNAVFAYTYSPGRPRLLILPTFTGGAILSCDMPYSSVDLPRLIAGLACCVYTRAPCTKYWSADGCLLTETILHLCLCIMGRCQPKQGDPSVERSSLAIYFGSWWLIGSDPIVSFEWLGWCHSAVAINVFCLILNAAVCNWLGPYPTLCGFDLRARK